MLLEAAEMIDLLYEIASDVRNLVGMQDRLDAKLERFIELDRLSWSNFGKKHHAAK